MAVGPEGAMDTDTENEADAVPEVVAIDVDTAAPLVASLERAEEADAVAEDATLVRTEDIATLEDSNTVDESEFAD